MGRVCVPMMACCMVLGTGFSAANAGADVELSYNAGWSSIDVHGRARVNNFDIAGFDFLRIDSNTLLPNCEIGGVMYDHGTSVNPMVVQGGLAHSAASYLALRYLDPGRVEIAYRVVTLGDNFGTQSYSAEAFAAVQSSLTFDIDLNGAPAGLYRVTAQWQYGANTATAPENSEDGANGFGQVVLITDAPEALYLGQYSSTGVTGASEQGNASGVMNVPEFGTTIGLMFNVNTSSFFASPGVGQSNEDLVGSEFTGTVILSISPIGGGCVADVDDGSGTGTPDGGVTIEDLLYYLGIFDAGLIQADVDDGSATGIPDGGVTIDDLLYFLARFDSGC